METGTTFTVEEEASRENVEAIRQGVHSYNERFAERDNHRFLTVLARDRDGRIVGGLTGGTYWRWLHIDYLWVESASRRHGIGRGLMLEAEREALRRRCRHAHVETHDFQAPEFYRKSGYVEFARLEDLPPGHTKIFLRKDLSASV
ncbi:MAG TPA: GNAT family N-acetyltransferase [Spirochaetia bacterium]|nr:GNAT family N-acetyltransferase [Spirochaetia bacterium]